TRGSLPDAYRVRVALRPGCWGKAGGEQAIVGRRHDRARSARWGAEVIPAGFDVQQRQTVAQRHSCGLPVGAPRAVTPLPREEVLEQRLAPGGLPERQPGGRTCRPEGPFEAGDMLAVK